MAEGPSLTAKETVRCASHLDESGHSSCAVLVHHFGGVRRPISIERAADAPVGTDYTSHNRDWFARSVELRLDAPTLHLAFSAQRNNRF